MPPAQPPYDQLYIYVILGDARGRDWTGQQGFLGLWLEEDMSFVFFDAPQDELVNRLLAQDAGLSLEDRHHMTYEQWQGGLDMEPMELDGLSVVPAWLDYQARPGQKVLRLDPGLVFGNGLHPTTRHCLELLCLRAGQEPLGRVLDLGCGTGILALAAALLGASRVTAVDLNPLCVSTTRNNADLNQLDIQAIEGPAQEFISHKAEVVLANLHYEAQKQLWSRAGEAELAKDVMLSGITRSQVGEITDDLLRLGYRVQERREAESTWFTLWFVRD